MNKKGADNNPILIDTLSADLNASKKKVKKKGLDAATLFGWFLLAAMVFIIVYGLLSSGACDRLLVVAGALFIVWLFFGSPFILQVEHGLEWKIIIFLSLTIAVLWAYLKITGICVDDVSIWQALVEVATKLG